MKPILMIHEIRDWMFDINLEDYTLTFDDGLYSQYYYLEEFKKINTDKIFFISTNIIHPNEAKQSLDFPVCSEAHRLFFEDSKTEHYMNWNQIHEIHESENCYIGGHSHYHYKYKDLKLKELYDVLIKDTELMISNFKKNGIDIEHFCYPYNIQYPLYNAILEKHNITKLYGNERIAIEDLR